MGEKAVKDAIDHYFSSLNAKDLQGVSVACHFPHFRVMGNNTVYEWKTADDLFTWFQSHVSDDGWGYSELDELTVEKFSDQKFHASLKFGRYQADGTLIGNYKSLYIVIFKDGRWGITGGSGSG